MNSQTSIAQMVEMWSQGDIEWDDLPIEIQDAIDEVMTAEDSTEIPDDPLFTAEIVKTVDEPLTLMHKADEEHRFTLGPWYIPNKYDAHGEWTDADELQKALWGYVKTGDRDIRLQHHKEIVAGEWLEALSFPVPVTIGMTKNADTQQVTYPAGTVFLGVQWRPWAWEMVKKGKIQGFSIGGAAARIDMGMPDDVQKSAKIANAYQKKKLDTAVMRYKILGSSQPSPVEVVKSFSQKRLLERILEKASFGGDRSAAGRYAAEQRWLGHVKVLKPKQQREDNMRRTEMVGGRGPYGHANSHAGKRMQLTAPSLASHIDFDLLAKTLKKQGMTLDSYDSAAVVYSLLTPARRAQWDKEVTDSLAGVPSREGGSTVWCKGGGGGAGKSDRFGVAPEVPQHGDKDANGNATPRDAVMSNADDVKVRNKDYQSLLAKGDFDSKTGEFLGTKQDESDVRAAAGFVHEESSLVSTIVVAAAIARRKDLIIDGTFDNGIEKSLSKLDTYAKLGAKEVRGVFFTCDTETAMSRANGRALKTKRFVHEPSLIKAHVSVSKFFETLVNSGKFKSMKLIDTNDDDNGETRKPSLIFQMDDTGKQTIVNPDAYKRFQDKKNGLK